jgi:hypothetical protein
MAIFRKRAAIYKLGFMSRDLNPEKALIFRIVHRKNMPQVLASGCYCKSVTAGKPFTQIGNLELISKRDTRVVPCGPGGTLSDYVPFYFTPYSPMLYNIKTGYGGVQKHPVGEIIILISSLHTLKQQGIFKDGAVFGRSCGPGSDHLANTTGPKLS